MALDLDPAAALLLSDFSSMNASFPRAFVGTVAALSDGARFDLALVNVVPSEIAGDLPRIAALVRPGGRAIFSGILETEAGSAAAAIAAAGFEERLRKGDGEWIAFVAERRRPEGGA